MSKSIQLDILKSNGRDTTLINPGTSGFDDLALTTATIYESREFDLLGVQALRFGVKFGGSFTPTQGTISVRCLGLTADGATLVDSTDGVFALFEDWEPRHATNNSILFDRYGNLLEKITPGVSYPFVERTPRHLFTYPRCKIQFRVKTIFDDTPPTLDAFISLIR